MSHVLRGWGYPVTGFQLLGVTLTQVVRLRILVRV